MYGGAVMHAKSMHGLTLVELLVAVAVFAILMTMGIPSFQSTTDRNRLKGAVETVFADVQFAHSEAIKRGQTFTMDFITSADVTGGWCYGMSNAGSCTCSTANSCQIDGAGNERVVNTNNLAGVRISDVTFDDDELNLDGRRGHPIAGSGGNRGGSIVFTSQDGLTAAIQINALGRVRICSDDNIGYGDCA